MRRPTLTERKPPPTGVVIGPFSAVPFWRIDSSTCSGSGLPSFSSITSVPACWTSQSNSTPVASSTRRVASASSGPVPSPGIRVTRCAIRRRTLPTRIGAVPLRVMSCAMAAAEEVRRALGRHRGRDEHLLDRPGRGVLMYRGYDIAELAEHSTYEEVAYLLLEGELPRGDELDGVQGGAGRRARAAAAR